MSPNEVEVWRGGVKFWQLDEMGHLNVRYYVSIAMEGLAGLAAQIGLSGAFRPDAGATLLVKEHHIRFLREARARTPLHMTAGILSLEETEARVLFTLWHSETGEPAATLNTLVAHVTAEQGRPFPWPSAARARAEALMVPLPDHALPKSVPLDPVEPKASRARADELNLQRIAAGSLGPAECDALGRMHAELFMDYIIGGIPQFGFVNRQTLLEHLDIEPDRLGAAALEYRLIYLDWLRAGDLYELRTGGLEVTRYGQNIIHWLLDGTTGKAVGSCQAFIASFDLQARKLLPLSEPAQDALKAKMVPGMSL